MIPHVYMLLLILNHSIYKYLIVLFIAVSDERIKGEHFERQVSSVCEAVHEAAAS